MYAAKKAIVAGKLRAGDPFPSVRALSQELKINPNTAHKVVAHLISEGLLETHPGIGTVVAISSEPSRKDRAELLGQQMEMLVVEAMHLGLDLPDLEGAIAMHWNTLNAARSEKFDTNRKRSHTEKEAK